MKKCYGVIGFLLVLLNTEGTYGQYVQQGNKLTGTDCVFPSVQQGNSVSISSDGNIAIEGAPGENGNIGAAWIFTRSNGTWNQLGKKITGTNTEANSKQGFSVAISSDGNTAVIGGPGDNNYIGAIWIFTRSDTTWIQQGNKIIGTGAIGQSQQGYSVSISADGNTVIEGGYSDHSSIGAAWIFTRTGQTWTQQGAKIVGTGYISTVFQGYSVSISGDGNTAIVGGLNDDSNIGAAWIFTRSNGIWTQQGAKLVGTGNTGNSFQGASVGISYSGNTVIIGGIGDNSYQGAVWIFTRIGNVWTQQGNKLVGTGNSGSPEEGYSVSVSSNGNTAVVGGNYDGNGFGAVWVFIRTNGVWSQQGNKLVGQDYIGIAHEGSSVCISADGNNIIMGGPNDNTRQGAVWVFTLSGNLWTQQGNKIAGSDFQRDVFIGNSVSISADGNTSITGGFGDHYYYGAAWIFTHSASGWAQDGGKLAVINTYSNANSGYSCAISADGNTAILGGYYDNNGTGAAWVFSKSNGIWSQQGGKFSGTDSVGKAWQGCSVSISADGNTAIVGGELDNNSNGAAWIFVRSNGVWTQQGNKLVGTGASGHANQGVSVSISADGNTAIIGGNSDNSTQGAVWIFTRSNGVWTQQGNKIVGLGAVGNAFQGTSVSISADGNTAVSGGFLDNSGVGAVWVFIRSGGIWTQQGTKLVGSNASGSAFQGTSVAISADGNNIVTGGTGDNHNLGAVWIFTRSGITWNQKGDKLVGTGSLGNSNQGISVAISSDGSTIISGGSFENYNEGAVWVFSSSPTMVENNNGTPVEFSLLQNYPNPFNPSTNIKYSLKEQGHVKIILYDILGKETAVIVNEDQNSGLHTISFNGSNLSSGIYIYSLNVISGNGVNLYRHSQKMVLLK